MSKQTQELFIKSVKEAEPTLAEIGLSHYSTIRKGYATYIEFKGNEDTLATLMLGPSDWHVEVSVITNQKKYEFKDLLQIPSISEWTKNNKFEQRTNEILKDEVDWVSCFLVYTIQMLETKTKG